MKLYFFVLLILNGCTNLSQNVNSKIIHLSPGMRVSKITQNTYVATDTDFFWSNILISKVDKDTVLIASSPFDSHGTKLMINWIKNELKPKKIFAINTHFHRDGIAGNQVFHQYNVETWANEKTIAYTKEEMKKPLTGILRFIKNKDLHQRIRETKFEVAQNSFSSREGKKFKFSNEEVEVYFPGHAHSPDNVVVYLKNKKILFGGCMIKPRKDLGYLGVANVKSWDIAMKKLKRFSPKIVVPGHGKWGGSDFLSKTQANINKYLQQN